MDLQIQEADPKFNTDPTDPTDLGRFRNEFDIKMKKY